MTCGNCGRGENARLLDRRQGGERRLISSDGALLEAITVERWLCPDCGCVEIRYTPEDALARFFASAYDTGALVQNNLVVTGGKVRPKRSLVQGRLFAALAARATPQADFLEIACGRGELTAEIAQDFPGWRGVGIDPSDTLPDQIDGLEDRVTLIRGFFDAALVAGRRFDVVIAHGLLNRAPPLPLLRDMVAVAQPGALISLEFLTLEDNCYCPHIWDHPFMYTADSFRAWCAETGLALLNWEDCGSAIHVLAAVTEQPGGALVSPPGVRATEEIFRAQERQWQQVAATYQDAVATAAPPLALFGAGLFTAVLGSLVDFGPIEMVIDEVKAGGRFFDLPVVDLATALKRKPVILLCVRPQYQAVICGKLESVGLPWIDLGLAGPNPALASEEAPHAG
ncbi:MAG: class I SAM-dependent methyltransferase [Magnetospiraceae bacterium]